MADDGKLEKWREARRRSSELEDEAFPIVRALRDGNLEPLASYLKGGGLKDSPDEVVSIPESIAHELVSMIDGDAWCWFHLQTIAKKRGKTWTSDLSRDKERDLVGFFVEKRTRELPRGSYESVIQEACDRFAKKRTYVTEAHAEVKAYLLEAEGRGADGWRVLRRLYSAEIA